MNQFFFALITLAAIEIILFYESLLFSQMTALCSVIAAYSIVIGIPVRDVQKPLTNLKVIQRLWIFCPPPDCCFKRFV